jgi:2-succinyl-6-hydroxy-2,4-cyclohexadiene-1-carboxylate synthase
MAPAIVLLHGFTNTSRSWDPVVAALGERYNALAPDIRGHGSASDREPVTLDAVLADIAALEPERFTLAGYSMGGRIALHAALGLPDRVDGLVLVGASPGLADPAERSRRRREDERLADEIEGSTIAQFARRWAETSVLADQPAAVRDAVNADRLRNSPPGLARALRGLGTGALPPLWDRLDELRIPVVLAIGERDHKFRGIAAEMADRLSHAEIAIVPDAGHAAHLEAPDRVAKLIAG